MNKVELHPSEQAKLADILLPEEELQWAGHSEAFPLVSKENKNGLMVRWLIAIVCAVVLSVIYAVWVSHSDRTYNILVELVILIAVAYFGFVVSVLDRRTLMNRALYCITNKRVLVFVADRPAIALNRAGLNSRCVSAEDGCIHILFGAAIDVNPRKYRITTIVSQTDKSGENSIGAIFYNIKKDDIPEDILTFS